MNAQVRQPAPVAMHPEHVQPAIRWFLLHLVASGLTLDEAHATIDAATAAEAEGLTRAGLG